jgi:hypothetical protein
MDAKDLEKKEIRERMDVLNTMAFGVLENNRRQLAESMKEILDEQATLLARYNAIDDGEDNA